MVQVRIRKESWVAVSKRNRVTIEGSRGMRSPEDCRLDREPEKERGNRNKISGSHQCGIKRGGGYTLRGSGKQRGFSELEPETGLSAGLQGEEHGLRWTRWVPYKGRETRGVFILESKRKTNPCPGRQGKERKRF